MKFSKYAATIPALALVMSAGTASAVTFDDNVTPDVIFGSGNANGGFTVDRANGIELGLRGKLRFDENNLPQSTYNSNGDGTYTFRAGAAPGGFGYDPNSPTTPIWSFDWSVNSNFDGLDGLGGMLDSLAYELRIDGDPGAGTDFAVFDPINVSFADHAIGDNTTGNSAGAVASNAADYGLKIANNNVAQNSWNYEFFNEATDNLFLSELASFNPNTPGIYTIQLEALGSDGSSLAATSIDINVAPVPVPAALPLLLAGLGGLGLVARRKRKAA